MLGLSKGTGKAKPHLHLGSTQAHEPRCISSLGKDVTPTLFMFLRIELAIEEASASGKTKVALLLTPPLWRRASQAWLDSAARRRGRGRSRSLHRQAMDGLSMKPSQDESELGISRSAGGTPCLVNATEWPRGD